jgi:hypothetical protein
LGGKLAHVQAGLGDEHLGGVLADAGALVKAGHRGGDLHAVVGAVGGVLAEQSLCNAVGRSMMIEEWSQ